MFKIFPLLYFYRTFRKRFTVVKIKELMKTDLFKYVVVLTSQDVYFGFSLLEKAKCKCIFGIIHSGEDTGDIVGWLVSKNLPQWVGNYSDWLMVNKHPAKKLFGEEESMDSNANFGEKLINVHDDMSLMKSGKNSDEPSVSKSGGSSSDMSLVSDGNEVPVQMATNTSTKSFRKIKLLSRK